MSEDDNSKVEASSQAVAAVGNISDSIVITHGSVILKASFKNSAPLWQNLLT